MKKIVEFEDMSCEAACHIVGNIKFGSTPSEIDDLAGKVLTGRKTATSSLLDLYLVGKKKRSNIGDYFTILNSADEKVVIVRIDRIQVVKFGDITEEFAKEEGDGSLENWQMIHKPYYSKLLAGIGKDLNAETSLVCEWFKVIQIKFPELHTERLDLVEITQSHLADYYQIFKDERAAKYYNIVPFEEEEEARKYIDWFQSRYKDGLGIRWGIKLKDGSDIIGTAGFNNYQKDHRANLGYDLRFEYWNKGYTTEALSKILEFGFETLGINRIEAEVMQGNVASERVLEKLEFVKEGVLRDWMYWNNKHYDMTMYSLLKKDGIRSHLNYPKELIHSIAQEIDMGMICYLNTDTLETDSVLGESYTAYTEEEFESFYQEVYDKVATWEHRICIEPPTSRESFRIMEDFITTCIPDKDRIKSRLWEAISKRKPFQNFKSIIDNSQYRQHWFDFKQSQLEQFVLEHLESHTNE